MSGRIAYVDERYILEAEFKDVDNLHVNIQDGVVLYIKGPNQQVTGPFSATRTDKGVYRYDYYPPDPGKYFYSFQDLNGSIIADKSFNVKKSKFDSIPEFPTSDGIGQTAVMNYVGVDAVAGNIMGQTAVMTYVAIDPGIAATVEQATTASTTYQAQDATFINQFNFGDAFWNQPTGATGGDVPSEAIGHQGRTSYPNGAFDQNNITTVLDYSGQPWEARHIAIDPHSNKIVFSAQSRANPEEWYLYTMDLKGTNLTKIYDAPIDLTNPYDISGLVINTRSDADVNKRIYITVDGSYGIVWRGFLISMAIDGSNQNTLFGPRRNLGELLLSPSQNQIFMESTKFAGDEFFSIDPFALICGNYPYNKPLNSSFCAFNGSAGKIYNFSAFSAITQIEASCNLDADFSSFSFNGGSSTMNGHYSDYTDEVIVSGSTIFAIDADTATKREVGNNGTQSGGQGATYVTIYDPVYQV